MARNTDEGAGEGISFQVPAGLYEFLTLHARRAILGKTQGDIALYMLQQLALAWDGEDFMGIKLPTKDFPKTEGDQGSRSP
jgi:hypothetical protein